MSNLLRTPRTCASVVACARQLAHGTEPADEALIESFVARNEHAAFALIVQRHGPMVLRVCRRVLTDRHAAEDAFQGTFLILAQHAKAIRKRAALASWLHGTALRVATSARRAAERARTKEVPDAQPGTELDPALSAAWREVQALVDREVLALPAIYREAFVRCCLEHASCAEVARELGVAEPTVRNRLSRARKRLQERLARRGVSLATVVAALAASATADAVPAAHLVAVTAEAACALAAGHDLSALAVRRSVITLVTGAGRHMFLTKLKAAVGVLVLCTTLCALATGEPDARPNRTPDRPLAKAKPDTPNPVAAELAALEGVWVTEKHDTVLYYVFAGNKCTIINVTRKEAEENRVEIDPTKSPKQIDLTGGGRPAWQAIYELKDNTLRIAGQLEVVRGAPLAPHTTRSPRPSAFKDVDSKSILLTFKRLTPARGLPSVIKTAPRAPRLSVPDEPPAPANDPDVSVLEAQVLVKRAQVKAAEVRSAAARRQFDSLDPAASGLQERNKAKAEVETAGADLEVRKAELVEAEARLRAARAKSERPVGPQSRQLADLKVEKVAFCNEVTGFGRFVPRPVANPYRPDERVQLYLELRNLGNQLTPDGFLTHVHAAVEVRDAENKLVAQIDPENRRRVPVGKFEKRLVTQSPLQDFHVLYVFSAPPAPGVYTVTVRLSDASGRRAVTSPPAEFRVAGP